MEIRRAKQGKRKSKKMQNPNRASPRTSQDFKPEKIKKNKRCNNPKNRTRRTTPSEILGTTKSSPEQQSDKFQEKKNPILAEAKGFKIRGTKCKQSGDVFKEARSHNRNKRRLRSRPSTSARPLMISLKSRPKTRAQFIPSKGW